VENCDFTLIITASYIPNHPNIGIIKETIESLKFLGKKNFPIIITHDYSSHPYFIKYLDNLDKYLKKSEYVDINVIVSKEHVHLTGIIRSAIDLVVTPYVLVIQHDLPFVKDFDIDGVICDMRDNPQIKYVRFNKRKNEKLVFDALNDLFGEELTCKNYTYTRTPAWSDNNHLCRTNYYRDLILIECIDSIPMEEQIHGRCTDEKEHTKWGTYLFDSFKKGPYIKHTDGRNFEHKRIIPLMNDIEIVHMVSYLDKNMTMLEIGSGSSTHFLSKIVKKLVSLEHNREWLEWVKELMKSNDSDWSYHLVEPSWPQGHPFEPSQPGQFDDYVKFIGTFEESYFDVILVDGRDRVRCSIEVISKLKRGGFLIIHDFWNRPKYHSLLDYPLIEMIEEDNSWGKIPKNSIVVFKKV